ncbi:hypothetical protein SSX86_000703 [Deinandra increscens subsp. villosa]|uniref:DUF7755 domain-containing protein n=1 Tax=Deinandra increscens subsp. villosa TaxID=3103831 RepID=A0AAP0HA64_9ASTR
MESLVVRRLICDYTTSAMVMPIRNPPISTPFAKIRANRHTSFVLRSKKSNFQDFQGYAKPSRLLPAHEVKPTTESSSNRRKFWVMLCLVDKNGDSILQRISATSSSDLPLQSNESNDKDYSNLLHFQRGSIDHFSFEGPAIGKLEALWIGLDSGQWRLAGITVTCWSQNPSQENENDSHGIFQYDFTADNVMLGDRNDVSMIELRPEVVTNISRDNLNLNENISPSSSLNNISNEESMKEYADLKFSLLLYDALLIVTGSTVASFTAGENAAFAFLTGGIGGFLYLLLLQRSVDELPSPVLDRTGGLDQMFGRFKGQVTILVLALTFAVVVVRLGAGDESLVLTPKDIVAGMMGFLSSKVAVLLAAFKPLPAGTRQS